MAKSIHGTGYFWMRRLQLATGAVLAFAFIVMFLVPYSAALSGPGAFNALFDAVHRVPLLGELELIFIALPLLFHLGMGLMIVYSSQVNVVPYGGYRNWMYLVQRIAGIAMIPFAVYHIYTTRLAFLFSGRHVTYSHMHKLLLPSQTKLLYCVGIIAAAIYITNGASLFLVKCGVASSRRSQDAISIAMWVAAIVLAAWGVRIVFAF